jgi:DNA topoisomerase-1
VIARARNSCQTANERDASTPNVPPVDPEATAAAAHLRYVSPDTPGIRRERTADGFRYLDNHGQPVTDEKVLARIRSLAIPPAYEDVWICRHANGHLQAVGRDARGRKQYRYHPRWRLVRDESKYHRMLLFGRMLPKMRAQVDADLRRQGLPREKVLAAVVRLLETTLVRIGNEEYVKANRSFGLTTLRNRHVKVNGSRLAFDFRGKSGIQHHINLRDAKLARVVKRLQDLPGQEVFQYLGETGGLRSVGSDDVNAYLREIAGEEITAKDFRTWAATNLAALALSELAGFDTQAKAKKNVVQAVEAVSKLLGNTPTICRKCYIHPAIFDGYMDGTLMQALKQRADERLAEPKSGMTAEEVLVMGFLSERLGNKLEQVTVSKGKAA